MNCFIYICSSFYVTIQALGPLGINMMEFCKSFNAATESVSFYILYFNLLFRLLKTKYKSNLFVTSFVLLLTIKNKIKHS